MREGMSGNCGGLAPPLPLKSIAPTLGFKRIEETEGRHKWGAREGQILCLLLRIAHGPEPLRQRQSLWPCGISTFPSSLTLKWERRKNRATLVNPSHFFNYINKYKNNLFGINHSDHIHLYTIPFIQWGDYLPLISLLCFFLAANTENGQITHFVRQ